VLRHPVRPVAYATRRGARAATAASRSTDGMYLVSTESNNGKPEFKGPRIASSRSGHREPRENGACGIGSGRVRVIPNESGSRRPRPPALPFRRRCLQALTREDSGAVSSTTLMPSVLLRSDWRTIKFMLGCRDSAQFAPF
jgi:hypothetical protein